MPGNPTVSYAALCRSLSRERLAAYSLETDKDSIDGVARYQWNMALAAAVTPVLHLVEVAFRNAIYTAGIETTAGRQVKWRIVPCWLDTTPTLLETREERDVIEAVLRLGKNPRRHTPGHLIGELGFGFWLRLCNRPYEHGRSSGPQLWPAATKRFPHCPRSSRNRTDIGRAFAEVRDFRNLVAHHQPIWDRDPVGRHRLALELLGWMNPSLAAVAEELSTVETIFEEGHERYRTVLARVLTI
jgi:hypothetical protein